jgi:hypothetical protein
MTADRVNMTTTLKIGQDVVPSAESPGKIISFDQFGYVYEYAKEGHQNRGMPQDTYEYVSSGTNSGAVINLTASTLNTTGAGIAGVLVRLENAAGLVEWRRVLSNASGQITLDQTPAIAIASGTKVDFGAIVPNIRSLELRFINPAVLESILFDTHDPSGSNAQTYSVVIYGAADGNLYTEGNESSKDSRTFQVVDLQRGEGRIWFRPSPSRSIQIDLSWVQRKSSPPTILLSAFAFIRTWEHEQGRSLNYNG